jgi:hypothetical protein
MTMLLVVLYVAVSAGLGFVLGTATERARHHHPVRPRRRW